MDSYHLSLVVTEYAKFHALSFAIKILKPEKFKKIEELIGANIMKAFDVKREDKKDSEPKGVDIFFGSTLEAVKNKPRLLEAVKKYNHKAYKFMLAEDPEADKRNVISHADCWSANLMFKYEDPDIQVPTKLCIIDWQMALLATPIHDLSYFFYINAGKNDLENYMRYLHLYHTTLSDTLRAFGLDPEDVYSFELFEKDWKENSKIGFFMTSIMLQQTLSEGKTHDFEKIADEGKSVYDLDNRKVEVSELFKQRMEDLVEFLVDHKFI
jgi:thiamine kinase-like enzyme